MGLYKLCTISWLSFSGRLLQIVGVMKFRIPVIVSGMALAVSMYSNPAKAEDKIQAFVSPDGKVVFTNLVDNTTHPLQTSQSSLTADEVPASLRTLVDTISASNGVDPALVRAVMKTESNFNRWAVSSKGALGLMQLIPSTGRRYGVRDFFDPEQNISGGVQYLRFLLDKFNGDVDLSVAAYNAGENLVERLGRIPPIPETTVYVQRVRAVYKKKSAPVTAPTAVASAAAASSVPEPAKIYKTVDANGIKHFSNIEPPN